ncbi:diaminopimelate decarboxylase [Virgibacillus halophilus]|uniref:diaminopimelate decarboxylase n=1 Tax=Tigheibacillus halophilus TaxID=361280 RepID=UPI0036432B8A
MKIEASKINQKGHLMFGGLDTVELAKKYGTPVYIYDVSMIRHNCRAFVDSFKKQQVAFQVAYASKAFSSIAMMQVAKQEGMSIDVVSEAELYTALQAGFPVERIHMHGNNKSEAELEMAITNRIGCIVIDNFYEITLLDRLLRKHDCQMDVLIRVTPGIESETHKYIMTGNVDSKFGFSIQNGQAEQAFLQLQHHDYIQLKGLHCHIGSQIFDSDRFIMAAEILFDELRDWNQKYGFVSEVLNLGGGFGIRYTSSDKPLPLEVYAEEIVKALKQYWDGVDFPFPEIWIEPGRSIVGEAGMTLYTVGSMKDIPGIRRYVAVDGGMADNIRPALYEAEYECIVANKADQPDREVVSIAGKCCESGDMLIKDIALPDLEANDIIAVLATGAYGYSMASHYNRFANAPVVFLENGVDHLVVRGETYKDVVRNDLPYEE